MKTLVLTIALATALSGATAFGYESHHDNDRVSYSHDRREGLDRHVNHLNRMLQHVRWQLRQYRANWRIRRDVENISHDVDRVNRRFRNGDYNAPRLRQEVERLHERLHGVEERLQVRSGDFYRWD
jgi:hypothetical protein